MKVVGIRIDYHTMVAAVYRYFSSYIQTNFIFFL